MKKISDNKIHISLNKSTLHPLSLVSSIKQILFAWQYEYFSSQPHWIPHLTWSSYRLGISRILTKSWLQFIHWPLILSMGNYSIFHNTVQCRNDMADFIRNPYNRHPTAHLWGGDMGWGVFCDFKVWFIFCICHHIADWNIMVYWAHYKALDCICIWFGLVLLYCAYIFSFL